MQTYNHFPLLRRGRPRQSDSKNVKFLFTLALCMAFSLIFVHGTYADNVHKIMDKDIVLTFNGKTIDQKRGIVHSDFNKVEENTLLIALKSKVFEPNENVNLQVILARGTRPLNAKDLINFSDQVEIDLTNLLLDAKPGDRIVLSFNDDKRIMVIPIS